MQPVPMDVINPAPGSEVNAKSMWTGWREWLLPPQLSGGMKAHGLGFLDKQSAPICGMTNNPGLARLQAERAKSPELNEPATAHRTGNAVQDGIQYAFRFQGCGSIAELFL